MTYRAIRQRVLARLPPDADPADRFGWSEGDLTVTDPEA
jgi:hypothetical protein